MKTRLLLSGLLLAATVSAQRNVDLDKFSISAQYRALPQIQIDTTYRTFNVEIETTRLMQPLLNTISPEKSVWIDGWRKLDRDGHIRIKIRFEDILPESVSTKERIETIKNRNGQITGTRTYYSQEVIYTFQANAILEDYRGMNLEERMLANRNNKMVYRSPEFAIKTVADGYFALNSISIAQDLFRRNVQNAVNNLSNQLTRDYGYQTVTSTDIMWIVGSRKDAEYDDHRKAFQIVSDAFFRMSADKPTDEIRVMLQPAIDYFNKIKRVYNGKSKRERKLRYASYYNLAVIYYYLDDPMAMMNEAKGLRLNDYDTGDATGFEHSATNLKNVLQINNMNTRHFPIDITKFKGPYERTDVTSK